MDDNFFKENFSELLGGAKKMQKNIDSIKNEIKELNVVGNAGAGLVKITLNGERKIINVEIDPSILDDKEMLQDLVLAAGNDANKKIEDLINEKTQSLIGNNIGAFFNR